MPTTMETLALGKKYHQAGNLASAELWYRQVLQAEPRQAEAWFRLGSLCHEQGRFGEAVTCYQQTLQLQKGGPETYYQLGNSLMGLTRYSEAAASYQQALNLQPDHAEAHNNRGVALAEQKLLPDAIAHYNQALRLNPDYAEAHVNLGNALKEQGHLEQAVLHYRRSLEIKPDHVATNVNLGGTLAFLGRMAEATAIFQKALQLRPDLPEVYNALGLTQMLMGFPYDALENFRQALRIKPDLVDAHNNRSLTWLLLGNLEEGWIENEWRWLLKDIKKRSFLPPLWDGSPLAGRTILLHAEQGLGDTIQFVRYATLVKQCGGKVIVGCQGALIPLLGSFQGIESLITDGSPWPEFHCHAPLMSLPGIFRTTLATIPADVPYLFADPQRVQRWRQELGAGSALKIGISWQGSPTFTWDRLRSIPLRHFAPLGQLPDVRLISLQKGPGTEQMPAVADQLRITDLGSTFDAKGGAFMDTAAVMMNLDLVITSDTAVAHLAGALGVPVWIALSCAPDWRFLLDREDSPWYPTARLFRQTKLGNWDEVFERIAGAVKDLLAARQPH